MARRGHELGPFNLYHCGIYIIYLLYIELNILYKYIQFFKYTLAGLLYFDNVLRRVGFVLCEVLWVLH
jgi:hypothetical protein